MAQDKRKTLPLPNRRLNNEDAAHDVADDVVVESDANDGDDDGYMHDHSYQSGDTCFAGWSWEGVATIHTKPYQNTLYNAKPYQATPCNIIPNLNVLHNTTHLTTLH